MTTYSLYVKTHQVTGLKYLGYTKSSDPHKYTGSGKYWRLHLKKHGKDYNTKILHECNNKEEITTIGTYYSNLWNVVESKEWANLRPETGDGGGLQGVWTNPNKGKTFKEIFGEEKASIIRQKLRNSSFMKTPAGREQHRQRMLRTGGPMKNPETVKKQKAKTSGENHWIRKNPGLAQEKMGGENHYSKKEGYVCKTIGENNPMFGKKVKRVTCEHCNKEVAINGYAQWHGDKCKSNFTSLVANTDR
jgi:hypothetical protein